ncbi:class I SAM-dependent methyltransferase [Thioclava sp. GXIMD4216]|uniref:Class I SAM-dependent methyltransferase n=1 Tax=Thioclava litoralis TaxID=3076557 RepID=A0ABZ1DXD8_9RHOB|nr:class I SAM-dependent methyltransferase [Thioclava sp. FTW29]
MWDQRYAHSDYVFGTAPAEFVRRQAGRLTPGMRVLSLAEGEGRNAVFLAEQGLEVTGVELSAPAREKAQRLAASRGVTITMLSQDLRGWDWPVAEYDALLACFIQFADPAFREDIFDGMRRAVAPGGVVMIHGFARRQPRYGTGGPSNVEQLYDLDLLREAFPRWKILHQADYDADLSEGEGHSGRAALIDFVMQRPS